MVDVPVNPTDAFTIVTVTSDGQTAFDYDFRSDFAEDLRATYETAAGVETPLVGGVDFTATGLGTEAGGTITLVTFTGTVTGDTLTIYRAIEIERSTDYTRDLFSNDINAEQDRVFMIMQELRRDIGRAILAEIGSDVPTADDVIEAAENALASEQAAEAAAAAAEAAAEAAALRDPTQFDFFGNGTAGPYNVGEPITADSAIIVFVDGVQQTVGLDYTYSGPNITFLTLVPTASNLISGMVWASRGIGVPSPGSVTEGSLSTPVKNAIPSFGPDADVSDVSRTSLLLTYHKARAGYPIGFFGNSKTAVGGGNAANDTAAVNTALNSGEVVDVTNKTLQINDEIVVNAAGACVGSSILASRVGASASSKIVVVDDLLPRLFDVRQPNFEASGFFIECGSGNLATTLFHFERVAGSPSDIDAVLKDISHEGGAKFFHHYGRGLKLRNITSGNVKTCFGDIDWPASWTPNGQSNDTIETGMRGYEFSDLRMHGSACGIRNIGANAKNMRGLLASNWQGDIGVGNGGLFVGIPGVGSSFNGMKANIGATIAGGLFDLWAGSRDATFSNFSCVGIKAGVTRLNRTAIIVRSTAVDPSSDLKFIGGEIGPTNRSGVILTGAGAMQNISFLGVGWDRTNIEGTIHFPILVQESGGTFTEVTIKLDGCNFKFGGEIAPTHIVGGLNSALVHLMKDVTSTKPSAIPWAQSNVIVS